MKTLFTQRVFSVAVVFCLFFLLSIPAFSQTARTFYSIRTGDWDSSTTWSQSSYGTSSVPRAGDIPLRTDNVVIHAGHTVTINDRADNGSEGISPDGLGKANIGPFTGSALPMFYHTGNILIEGILTSTGIDIILDGYTEILPGGTLAAGSTFVNTGYLDVASGSGLSIKNDLVLTSKSTTIINSDVVLGDDLIIDRNSAILCGTGSGVLQNGGDSQLLYTNGAKVTQLCSTVAIACTGSSCASTFPVSGKKVIQLTGGNGPAGVGIANGASGLVLWLDATRINANNNTHVKAWNDFSGYGHHFTQGNGATYKADAVNGYSALEFNGSSNYFERAFTKKLNGQNFSVFTACLVTLSPFGKFKTLISSRDTSPLRGYALYSTDHWSFWSGDTKIWVQVHSGSTTNTWASQSAWFTAPPRIRYLSINNAAYSSKTGVPFSPNTAQNTRIGAGQNESRPTFYFKGRISEVIIYENAINPTQLILLNNYLAAKYNFTLTSNDLYTMDNPANGDYDHEVAGIGQAVDWANHPDASGSIVRIWNPGNLGNNEYLFWGHNKARLTTITGEAGAVDGNVVDQRLTRQWAVSEKGDVGTVNISFDLSDFSDHFLGSSLRLLIDRNGNGFHDNDVEPIAGSYIGKKIIFSGVNFKNGDRFTLGSANLNHALPVTLISFTATPHPYFVLLEWKTASEVNNDYFEVQRSLSGEAWENIGRVPGAGNSTQPKTYSHRDEIPLLGTSYYRLKQVDYDGKHAYSRVVKVDYTFAPPLQFFPNPSTGIFTLKNEQLTIEQVELLNVLGHKVPFKITSNMDTRIDISNQPAGIYFIRIYDNGVLQNLRIIKE